MAEKKETKIEVTEENEMDLIKPQSIKQKYSSH